MQRPTLTVSEINKYIKDTMAKDFILTNVTICGEISNYKNHYSGHMYFTLKDESSTIKCVMFKDACMSLKFIPQEGMKVIIKGRVSVFERDGSYQLYANEMQPDGIGALHLAFEQLKKKLESEGLFDEKNKKPIPVLPQSIGIVTSPTGAAIKDILNILTRRFYNIKVIIQPVQVQGEEACKQIANAIDNFNILKNVDVIIVGRGGGSIEELWAFNEEIVARSIAISDIPIISAVGHETDFTIADFVSDLRAPTPSAAAELVVPNKIGLETNLYSLISRINYSMQSIFENKKYKLEKLLRSNAMNEPLDKIYQFRLRLDVINKHILKDEKYIIEAKKAKFGQLLGKLSALSPLNILQRGYCVSKKSNKTIKSIDEIEENDKIDVEYCNGTAICNVVNVIKKGKI